MVGSLLQLNNLGMNIQEHRGKQPLFLVHLAVYKHVAQLLTCMMVQKASAASAYRPARTSASPMLRCISGMQMI